MEKAAIGSLAGDLSGISRPLVPRAATPLLVSSTNNCGFDGTISIGGSIDLAAEYATNFLEDVNFMRREGLDLRDLPCEREIFEPCPILRRSSRWEEP